MVHDNFHFRAARPDQDLILSANHRVLGRLVRYLASFQLDTIRFLYKNFEGNHACILNDESGLGKTAAVAGFLSAILPSDNSKRCLIIVKKERVTNWRFHLDILTKLRVRLVTNEKDVVGDSNVLITTWDTLRQFPNLAKTVFNCVILDDRGDLTASKVCLNFLLRHFENRISLIVASTDVTLDIKQLHGFLRLCGRLDEKYQKLKVFEDKFSLSKPEGNLAEDRAVLEAYFQRREKVINYCRDFRLRRYRHQFEDILPLVHTSVYDKSIQEWREKELSKSSSLSSGSLKIISSSSEKNTEELFQTYFDPKAEKLLNEEVQKINENAQNPNGDKEKPIHDTEDMSPLLFESDSDEIVLPPPIQFNVDDAHTSDSEVLRPKAKKPNANGKSNEQSEKESAKDKSITPPASTTEKGKRRYEKAKRNRNVDPRMLRSFDRKTRRTKSCPSSRNAIIEVFRMVEQAEDAQKKKRRRRKRKTVPLDKEEAQDVILNMSSDTESEIDEAEKLEYHPDPVTTAAKVAGRDASPGSNYNFNVDLLSKTLAPDSSEIQIYSPEDAIVVLSSSTECSEDAHRTTVVAARKVIQTGKISPSPDIFENCEEYDFLCSQRDKSALTERRLLQKKTNKRSGKRTVPSCLQRLEDDFRSQNKADRISNNFLLRDCGGFTDIFTNMVQIHSTNIGRQTGNNDVHMNKITKYLSSQSFDSTQSNRPDTTTKDAEYYPKTPKRRSSSVSQKDSPQRSKKSPKSQRLTPMTPTGLTKWLIKKTPDGCSQEAGTSKTSKRKRLDLWFKD